MLMLVSHEDIIHVDCQYSFEVEYCVLINLFVRMYDMRFHSVAL